MSLYLFMHLTTNIHLYQVELGDKIFANSATNVIISLISLTGQQASNNK